MSSDDKTASEHAEAPPTDEHGQHGSDSGSVDWRAETTRLQQRLKKAEDINRNNLPFAQLGYALQNAKGGNKIIEKLQKGEALTVAEEKQLEEAKGETGSTSLSLEQVEELLKKQAQELDQRWFESRKAERAMEKLQQWAVKTYPGWEEVFETPEWNQHLNSVLASIEQGVLQVPESEPDPYKFAWKQTAGWLKSMNPELGKKTPAKKTEKQRREAISGTSVDAGGVTPEDSEEIPEYARLDTQPKFLGGGQSFSSLKRS